MEKTPNCDLTTRTHPLPIEMVPACKSEDVLAASLGKNMQGCDTCTAATECQPATKLLKMSVKNRPSYNYAVEVKPGVKRLRRAGIIE